MTTELQLPSKTMKALQRLSFDYFLKETNPENGLVVDKTSEGSPASIAATGLGLSAYPIAVERGFIRRSQARSIVLKTLRFFHGSEQSSRADATGSHGFYYHFLDMKSGHRVWNCELSTIDSSFLIAGMLVCSVYFDEDNPAEREIRETAKELYERVDWNWARNGGLTVSHGWRPKRGFIKYTWQGYNEALFLYILGLGSPTYPLPLESYGEWCKTYDWQTIYDQELLYSGPLFTHQISHLWIDFRSIQDAYMHSRGIDYFENSRRATFVQQAYAMDNPRRMAGYGRDCWGITASDGPGPKRLKFAGKERRFYAYIARGVPYGPDDGTLSPWAVAASLPFAPDIVLPAIQHFNRELGLTESSRYGFTASFNPTFPAVPANPNGWQSPYHFGINQGPIVLMIENYCSGLLWDIMRRCPYVVQGLRRAGFSGGWLGGA